jgi:filamentous hemagglutinin
VYGGNISTSGTVTGASVQTTGAGGDISGTGNITGANINTGGQVSATGDVTGGNIYTGGLVSSTGTVTGGNLATGGTATATGTITGGNVVTGGIVSAIGTVTGGNVATGGTVSATGTATAGNVATGGNVSATGNVTGGNILTSGYMSATGNVYASNFIGNISGNISSPGANTQVIFNNNGVAAATSGFTFDYTSNTVTVSANVNAVSFNGNVYSTSVSATGNVDAGNTNSNVYGTIVSASGNISGGNINTTGELIGGNIVISGDNITDTNGRVNFNTAGADVDFAVNGDTVANVFYIDAGTGTASFGNATQTTNAIVAFNSTNSILTPVGSTAQRPATGVTGMMRFNTTSNNLEIYDNAQWSTVGAPSFTVITDQQFNGTGSQTVFTLTANATTAGTIVSINGVQQIPTTAYAVSGVTLTFTEAPEVGDLIDVRTLTTTTTVYGISNGLGTASLSVVDGSPNITGVGNLLLSGTYFGDGSGLTNLNVSGNAISFGTSNVAVRSNNGNVDTAVNGVVVQSISPGLVNITGDLTVSGNATLSGNILGDKISNGTTSIEIQTPSGNANITVGGTSNVAVFASAGLYITGNISATGDVIAQNVNSLSDATLKANVAPIENAGAVVDGLNGVSYDWQDGSGHAYGMIAQRVEEVLPEAVKTDENGIKSINYSMVIPFLVETVKELRQDIAEIKAQLKK